MLKKKILIICPRFPYPVIGGDRLRIYQICNVLAKYYDLTLLSLCDKYEDLNYELPDDGIFKKVFRVYMPWWRSWINCIMALPTRNPLQVAYYKNNKFNKLVESLAIQHDAVFCHLIRVTEPVKKISGVKFLEMTDAISLNYKRVRQSKSVKGLRAAIFSIESRRLESYEKNIVKSFDHSFLVSEVDKKFLFDKELGSSNIVSVFSNGVDLEGLNFEPNRSGSCIVFIGNLYSLQNLDAVNFMIDEIMPIVWRERKDAKFKIIGRIRDVDYRRLKNIPGVIVTGEVDNISAEARSGVIGVCPVRLGAGIQNKVLEYMSLGLPVVSTSIGLEGLAAINGKDLEVVDEPVEFAYAILDLINDTIKAQKMSIAGRDFVERHHSWESQLIGMVKIINTTVNRC